jgi:hypothetical protein
MRLAMTDNDDDTQAAEPETTHVEPPTAAAPEQAWSYDDDTDTEQGDASAWHGRAITAGLVVLVASVAGVSIWLAATGFNHRASTPVAPSHVPTPTSTVTAAPPPPPAPVASPPTATTPPAPSPYASLLGKWSGHHRGLTVSPDGTIEMHIIDSAACPQCAAVDAPRATVHIGLTSYNGDNTDNKGRFGGYVKDSSDTRVVPAGLPVEVDVEPAGAYGARIGYRGSAPGRVMTISIKGMPVSDGWNFEPLGDASPFCDEAALGTVCGA